MKTAAVIYTGRFGDIVGSLPRSKWLHDHGYEVKHYCCNGFEQIFDATSYVKARVVPGDVVQAYEAAKKLAVQECDEVFDRQIFPSRTWGYRPSGKTWLEYYYEDIPELIHTPPLFDVECLPADKRLPPKSLLVSMHGYSSPLDVNWNWVNAVISSARKTHEIESVFYTCREDETPFTMHGYYVDHSPQHWLPDLMRSARMCLFRNSAPAWIAYGVGVPTIHLPDSCFPRTDSAGPAPNLIRLVHGAPMDSVNEAVDKALALPWESK